MVWVAIMTKRIPPNRANRHNFLLESMTGLFEPVPWVKGNLDNLQLKQEAVLISWHHCSVNILCQWSRG